MSVESDFLRQIARLKGVIFYRYIYQVILRSLLIFLFSATLVFFAEKSGYFFQGRPGSIYLAAIAVSVFLAFVTMHRNKRRFQDVLIDIDARLGLYDRLSTAYEIHQLGQPSLFSNLLMQDAVRKLGRLTAKQLFPPRGSCLYFGLFFLVITNIVLHAGGYFSHGPSHSGVDPEKPKQIGRLLKAYKTGTAGGRRAAAGNEPYAFYQKLDDMARKIENRSMTPRELLVSLNKMLAETQAAQATLAKGLKANLEPEDIEAIAGQNVLSSDQLSAGDLDKIKEALERVFDSRVPQFITRDVEQLSELRSLADFLSRMIDDIHQIESDHGPWAELSAPASPPEIMNQNNPGGGDRTPAAKKSPGSASGPHASQTKMTALDAGHTGEFDPDAEDGFGLHEGRSSLAGHAQSTGQEKTPFEIVQTGGPGIQDKTSTASQEQYSVHIRALTAIGRPELKEADIIRTYRQEIESVLEKADTPQNYREYIRNYFISIGLQTGKNDDDDS